MSTNTAVRLVGRPAVGQHPDWDGTKWVPADGNSLPSVTGQAGKFLETDGTTTSWQTITGTSLGALIAANNLSDIASASAARSHLGLGALATEDTAGWNQLDGGVVGTIPFDNSLTFGNTGGVGGDIAVTSGQISFGTRALRDVSDPFSPQDAATKAYVDATSAYVNPLTTLGDTAYAGASGVPMRLPGNTAAANQFLRSLGTGSAAQAPTWSSIAKADVGLGNVENTALSTWVGSTNLTTLGTVVTGTWNATAIGITKGGTGQITANAGFNALSPLTTVGDTLYGAASGAGTRLAGNTTTTLNVLTQAGDGSNSAAPAWLGTTGTGNVARATSPTFVTPTLGAASATTLNKLTLTTPATGSTLTIADGKTLTASNTLTFTGTDGGSVVFGTGGIVSYAAGANPAASLGLMAVNGSATTFMRSDGAPALDVTIAPTWTGKHTHRLTTTQWEIGYDSSNKWTGTVASSGGLTLACAGTAAPLTLSPGTGNAAVIDNGATAKFRLLPSGTDIYFQNTTSGNINFTGNNGTTLTGNAIFNITGNLQVPAAIFSASGAASAPAILSRGAPYGGGTGTTAWPLWYANDSAATASTTLPTAGTYIGVNGHGTAFHWWSGTDGVLKSSIDSTGAATFVGQVSNPTAGVSQFRDTSSAGAWLLASSTSSSTAPTKGLNLSKDAKVTWTNSLTDPSTTKSVGIFQPFAGALAVGIDSSSGMPSNGLLATLYAGTIGAGFTTGANVAAGDFALLGGEGTGTGAGGNVLCYVYPAGSSGSSLNAGVLGWKLSSVSGNMLFGTTTDLGATGGLLQLRPPASGKGMAIVQNATTPSDFLTLYANNATTVLGKWDSSANLTFGGTLGIAAASGSNTAATVNLTYASQQGTGTGAGSSHIWQVAPAGTTGSTPNTLVNGMSLDSTCALTAGTTTSGGIHLLRNKQLGNNVLAIQNLDDGGYSAVIFWDKLGHEYGAIGTVGGATGTPQAVFIETSDVFGGGKAKPLMFLQTTTYGGLLPYAQYQRQIFQDTGTIRFNAIDGASLLLSLGPTQADGANLQANLAITGSRVDQNITVQSTNTGATNQLEVINNLNKGLFLQNYGSATGGTFWGVSLNNAVAITSYGDNFVIGTGNTTPMYFVYNNNQTVKLDGSALTLFDLNIVTGTSTGSQIATAANQKIGKWGVTPVVQPTAAGTTTGHVQSVTPTLVYEADTFTGGVGTTAYTLGDLVRCLKLAGNIAA